MKGEIRTRIALPSAEHKIAATPKDSMLLRLPTRNLSETEIAAPTPDLAAIIKDMLSFAGANVQYDPKKGSLGGLHAVQLGYAKSMFLVDWNAIEHPSQRPSNYQPHFRLFANVALTNPSTEIQDSREGCFSLEKEIAGIVERSQQVTIEGLEVDLTKFNETGEIEFKEVNEPTPHFNVARVVQHEYDHGRGMRFPAVAHTLFRLTDLVLFRTTQGKEGFEVLPKAEEDALRAISSPLI
jgi:peptide deformylase